MHNFVENCSQTTGFLYFWHHVNNEVEYLNDEIKPYFVQLYLQFIDTQGSKYMMICTVQVPSQDEPGLYTGWQ